MPTWLGEVVSQERYDALRAEYEERAFMRKPAQGQLCAPMVISDSQPALRSQTNGQIYDSKSELRKEYRRAGVVEVGTEKQTRGKSWAERRQKEAEQKEACKAALYKAHSRLGHGAP